MKFLAPVILGMVCSACTPQAPTQSARVEGFAHSTNSGTSIIQSRINNEIYSLCNFARVEIESIVYNVTAKHCMIGFSDGGGGYDIVAIKNFTEFYRDRKMRATQPIAEEVEYQALSGIPRTTKISRYSPMDIVGKELSAVGCFPDFTQNRMVCYKITGKPYISREGLTLLPISIVDQKRMLSYDSTGSSTRLAGMSGAPVFDEHGDLFGVLSRNTNQGDYIQKKYELSFVMIEPIRTGDGTLLPSLVKQ